MDSSSRLFKPDGCRNCGSNYFRETVDGTHVECWDCGFLADPVLEAEEVFQEGPRGPTQKAFRVSRKVVTEKVDQREMRSDAQLIEGFQEMLMEMAIAFVELKFQKLDYDV